METTQPERQRGKRMNETDRTSKSHGTISRGVTYTHLKSQKKKKEEIVEVTISSRVNHRH